MGPFKDGDSSYGPWWPKGTKIRFVGKYGKEYQKEEAHQLLEVGNIYTVKHSKTFDSYSEVYLEEVERTAGPAGFNTVMFERIR